MTDTPALTPIDPLEALYEAFHQPIGIAIRCADTDKTAQRLYKARVKSNDSTLANLKFHKSPYNPQTELWIIHKRRLIRTGPPQFGKGPRPEL